MKEKVKRGCLGWEDLTEVFSGGVRSRKHGLHDSSRIRRLSYHIGEMIKIIGDDPGRDGLKKTPERYARALLEILSGYHSDPCRELNGAVFEQRYDGIVFVSNVKFFSLCEHHMLPFFGTSSVAYMPRNKIIGLSKIPRIIRIFASRLQVQERLTEEIGRFLDSVLEPEGVAVYMSAYHLCLAMRGVKKEDVVMETLFFSGRFKDEVELRKMFLEKVESAEMDFPRKASP